MSDGTHSVDVDSGIVLATGTWYFIVAWYDATLEQAFIQVNDGTPQGYAAYQIEVVDTTRAAGGADPNNALRNADNVDGNSNGMALAETASLNMSALANFSFTTGTGAIPSGFTRPTAPSSAP